MLERILFPPVAVAEVFHDPADAVPLREEEPVLRRATDKRRREFTTVRWCARRALAGIGEGPHPLLPDDAGAPRWPGGVVGSMTHCDGYRAAAVARTGGCRALGIDAEPDRPVAGVVLDVVALPGELRRLAALREAEPQIAWDRLLFSAKEAVYKTWYPLTGRPLGFHQADITLLRDGTFTAELAPSLPRSDPDAFAGRWTSGRGLLVTVIAVPGDGRQPPGPRSTRTA
ncbi:4'-phosphopantetheinyl transferase superfamily protein [Streptomyces sp. NPDC051582]|uniref:4'-phosphopantetheinyl transferase family protein n=1 Tax=Streptomyces sp. NPDC051582 TaxID=3155167 RepID=UPI003446AFD7